MSDSESEPYINMREDLINTEIHNSKFDHLCDAERLCGSIWFDNLKSISGRKLIKHLKLYIPELRETTIESKRASRGGLLLKFKPETASDLVYQHFGKLPDEIKEAHVHAPVSADPSRSHDVVVTGIPIVYEDEDIIDEAYPAPMSCRRFNKKGDKTKFTTTVLLSYESIDEFNEAIRIGVRIANRSLPASPYRTSQPVYCKRCKSLGPQHTDCVIRCAKCSGEHPTLDCQEANIECLLCHEKHITYECPAIAERESRRRERAKTQTSYREILTRSTSPTSQSTRHSTTLDILKEKVSTIDNTLSHITQRLDEVESLQSIVSNLTNMVEVLSASVTRLTEQVAQLKTNPTKPSSSLAQRGRRVSNGSQ